MEMERGIYLLHIYLLVDGGILRLTWTENSQEFQTELTFLVIF